MVVLLGMIADVVVMFVEPLIQERFRNIEVKNVPLAQFGRAVRLHRIGYWFKSSREYEVCFSILCP